MHLHAAGEVLLGSILSVSHQQHHSKVPSTPYGEVTPYSPLQSSHLVLGNADLALR